MRVTEIFTDIEGEGTEAGVPTLFVRLTGCNLRCSWCDTKYSYTGGVEMPVSCVAGVINKSPIKRVSITGGEPLLQKKEVLELMRLCRGKKFNIETNGAVSLKGVRPCMISMDIKPPSSGEHKKMKLSNLGVLGSRDQVKISAASKRDLEYALKLLGRKKLKCSVVIQPVYGKMKFSEIKKFIIGKAPGWRALRQNHKIK